MLGLRLPFKDVCAAALPRAWQRRRAVFLNRGSHRDTLIRFVLGVAVAAVLLLAAALVIGASRAAARGATATLADHARMALSDGAMRQVPRRLYAAAPPRRARAPATAAAR